MNYNAYDELMHYFQFELNVYLILAAIVLVGLIRTVLGYYQSKKANGVEGPNKKMKIYELLMSFLAIIGLANAMLFQGAMSDMPLESGHVWVTKATYIFIASMVLFLIQIGCVIMTALQSSRKSRK